MKICIMDYINHWSLITYQLHLTLIFCTVFVLCHALLLLYPSCPEEQRWLWSSGKTIVWIEIPKEILEIFSFLHFYKTWMICVAQISNMDRNTVILSVGYHLSKFCDTFVILGIWNVNMRERGVPNVRQRLHILYAWWKKQHVITWIFSLYFTFTDWCGN